ncbi:MAG: hypothetical protein JNM93_05270 [Bacteriovoracaceae bacterium]|nr:hypothetical protein [Bacteriovoracaceae bacterium]
MNILIPTDFTTQARSLLRYVLDLSQNTQEHLNFFLLNTYLVQMNTEPNQLLQNNDELKQKSKLMLEEEVEWARHYSKNTKLNIMPVSHMGSINNVILNLLSKKAINLVILGDEDHVHRDIALFLQSQNYPVLSIPVTKKNLIYDIYKESSSGRVLFLINETEGALLNE